MGRPRRRHPLGRWSALPADTLPVAFSGHAIERYGERLRPGLTREQVERELSRLLRGAVVSRQPPDWLVSELPASAFLRLGGDICLPLHVHPASGELIAATVVYRNMVGEKRRADLNRGRQDRRAGKRSARRAVGHMAHRDRPPPSTDEW